MNRFFKSFLYAGRGLKTTWIEEPNFAVELSIGISVTLIALALKFSFIELAIIILASIIVLGGEIVNSIVEDLCDKIEPNRDPVIGKIKDMAAAFVLTLSCGSVIVGALVFANHWFR